MTDQQLVTVIIEHFTRRHPQIKFPHITVDFVRTVKCTKCSALLWDSVNTYLPKEEGNVQYQ